MDIDTDRRRFIASVVGGAVVAATGTVSAQEDGGTTHEVEMITEGSEYYFNPIGLHIQPGDTVRWVNVEGAHSATAYSDENDLAEEERIPEGAESWNSGTLSEQGATFEHTFEEEGTYDYYCIPHKSLGMVGRIVVGEPGGPAEEGEIPNAPENGRIPTGEEIVEGDSLPYPFTGLEEGGGGLPFGMAQAAPVAVGGLIAAGVGYYFSEENKGEDGNNALAVGLASLVVGILLIIGVVMHLIG